MAEELDDNGLGACLQELEAVRARIAALASENAELERRLGSKAPASDARSPRVAAERAGDLPSVYRREDRLVRLEDDLRAANANAANLAIENAILRSRLERRTAEAARWGSRTVTLIAATLTLAALAVVWLVTESAGAVLFAAVFLGITWILVVVGGRITPDGTNSRNPPRFPSGLP
jgi:hypothetical protein